jgi:hypothetical protein
MKIGVTGTRSGMNPTQREQVFAYLKEHLPDELHHGDCVGVDVEVAEMAEQLGVWTVCHPPINTSLRGWHRSDQFCEPLSYFARNRRIVYVCDRLLVIPAQNHRQTSGGTWYTYDYAVKIQRPLKIFYPNGVTHELDYRL